MEFSGPGQFLQILAVAALLAVLGLLLARGRRAQRVAHAQLDTFVAAGDGILVVDARGRVLDARGAAAEILMEAFESPTGALPHLPKFLENGLVNSETRHLRFKAGAGRVLEIWTSDRETQRSGKKLRGVLVRDITTQRRDEQELIRLARHDSLTGLANRRLFLEDLKRHIEAASASGDVMALLYIDLDRFKEVNDTLGHGAGDDLLRMLGTRFLTHMRPEHFDSSTLPGGACIRVARLSGDEFAIIISKIADAEGARKLADRVLQLIGEPIVIGRSTLTSTASIGVSLFPKDGNSVEALIRSADVAVYAAKNRGRNRLAFYEHSIEADKERGSHVAQALRNAIERSELKLHYQPKVDLASGTTVGFEALLRWKSAELGVVRPNEFIPIAEERGLISEIGAWCLGETCRQIRRWRDDGFAPVPVSVNVSSIQFRDNDLQRVVGEALKAHDLEPELLELELTESLLLDEGERTALCLRDLRAIGVRIALDDFGTGYSALTYLNRFPLDVLKMDRGFLREIHFDSSSARIASAVVSMAHGLGLTVVAEGVDSEEQVAVLREMLCDQIQGFLYSPAVPPDAALRFLARQGGRAPLVPIADTHPGNLSARVADAGLATAPALKLSVAKSHIEPPRKENSKLLLVDDEAGSLQPLAMRLMRLGGVGVDLHHAGSIAEARLMINDPQCPVHALTISPSIDLKLAAELRKTVAQRLGSQAPLIVIGEEPDGATRSSLRELGQVCVLWTPFDDIELAYVIKAALTPRAMLARRLDVRVPVNMTVRLQIGHRREMVVLSSLSTSGAFLDLSDPLPVGTSIRIGFNLQTGSFQCFARVLYFAQEDPECPFSNSGIGVAFFSIDRGTELALRKAVEGRAARYLP